MPNPRIDSKNDDCVEAASLSEHTIRRERTFQLFGSAILTGLLSIICGPFSAHTYCENRAIVGVLAFMSILILVLLIRNRGGALWKRVLSDLGVVICLLTTAGDVAFTWYATQWCRQMLIQPLSSSLSG